MASIQTRTSSSDAVQRPLPSLPIFPSEIFYYIALFLPQSTLISYILVRKDFSENAGRWLSLDLTLRTFRQVKALRYDPSLCTRIRTLRLSAASAALCLLDRCIFPQLKALVYLEDWENTLWDSNFRPMAFTKSLLLSSITITASIELNNLVNLIKPINSLISLSCGVVTYEDDCRFREKGFRCSLKSLCILGTDSDKRPTNTDTPQATHVASLNTLLPLIGKSLELLEINIQGVRNIDRLSLAPLTHLRRCVIRSPGDQWTSMEPTLKCLSTLKSKVFDEFVIILPLSQTAIQLHNNVLLKLAEAHTLSGYIDILFGNPDPANPLGPPGEMTILTRNLYLGNYFDNREIFRSLTLPQDTSEIMTIIARPLHTLKREGPFRSPEGITPLWDLWHQPTHRWKNGDGVRTFLLDLCMHCKLPPTTLIPAGEIQVLDTDQYNSRFHKATWNGRVVAIEKHLPLRKRLVEGVQKMDLRVPIMARFTWLSLCHPNIQPVIGLTEAKPHKLVFPWSDRGNILNAITQLGKIESHSPLLSIDTWLKQIASGISYLHSRDIIHANIRSDFIYVDDTNMAVISCSPTLKSLRDLPYSDPILEASDEATSEVSYSDDDFLSEDEVSTSECSEGPELRRVHSRFYKADILSFGYLCNVLYDHFIEVITGKLTLVHKRPGVRSGTQQLDEESEGQDNYDEWMRILVSLAYNRAMVKLKNASQC